MNSETLFLIFSSIVLGLILFVCFSESKCLNIMKTYEGAMKTCLTVNNVTPISRDYELYYDKCKQAALTFSGNNR